MSQKKIPLSFLCLFILLAISGCSKAIPEPGSTATLVTETPLAILTESVTREITLETSSTPTTANSIMVANEEMKKGKEKAKVILDAIEQYRNEEGFYPDRLENLIPSYLKEIPKTDYGEPYNYLLETPKKYILWFKVTKKVGASCGYLKYLDSWDCSLSRDP